jgi:hypothetical protein
MKRHAAEDAMHETEQMRQLFDLLQEKNVELESAKFEAEKANLAKSEFLSSRGMRTIRVKLGHKAL